MSDPARSLDSAREYWQQRGRSEKWIQQRMMGQETRNKRTDYWKDHEIKGDEEYAILSSRGVKFYAPTFRWKKVYPNFDFLPVFSQHFPRSFSYFSTGVDKKDFRLQNVQRLESKKVERLRIVTSGGKMV